MPSKATYTLIVVESVNDEKFINNKLAEKYGNVFYHSGRFYFQVKDDRVSKVLEELEVILKNLYYHADYITRIERV